MERQRLAEWEKQRKAELVQHRQREQEKVLELKAKKENLDAEFEKIKIFKCKFHGEWNYIIRPQT